jgi:hypothetical protein
VASCVRVSLGLPGPYSFTYLHAYIYTYIHELNTYWIENPFFVGGFCFGGGEGGGGGNCFREIFLIYLFRSPLITPRSWENTKQKRELLGRRGGWGRVLLGFWVNLGATQYPPTNILGIARFGNAYAYHRPRISQRTRVNSCMHE